jgi:flagellar basal-body rod modification protein FlgD
MTVNPLVPQIQSGSIPSSTGSSDATNQINQDTFLKLLVAQMKYQNPLSPTDSTAFLTQTAQFTTVSTLQQIEKDQQAIQHTNQLLAASGMVGRGVTYSTTGIAPMTPAATTNVMIGGNLSDDAPVGKRVNVTTSVFNQIGTKIPLQLEFTRTADGWSMQASSKGQNIGGPKAITFDGTGERTSANITLSASDLDNLPDTHGTWPAAGFTVTMGDPADPGRLAMGSGASNVAVFEQDGGNGQSLTGVVTGIQITVDGPQLLIDGRSVPLSAVMEVQAPAL